MKPWQQELLYRAQQEKLPRITCQCCGEAVATELYLDLEPFGLRAAACERCVERNMYPTEEGGGPYA
jgi:hypothetical protein